MEYKLLGTIPFRGVDVKVMFDSSISLKYGYGCLWQMRSPDTAYQGIMYMDNNTGKISYPPDAVIPNQTDFDREILPKVVVTNIELFDEDVIKSLLIIMHKGYEKRNKKKDIKFDKEKFNETIDEISKVIKSKNN